MTNPEAIAICRSCRVQFEVDAGGRFVIAHPRLVSVPDTPQERLAFWKAWHDRNESELDEWAVHLCPACVGRMKELGQAVFSFEEWKQLYQDEAAP
ncbi:MAG: hypothetical protein GEU28_01305 [Dehalococcoidia bacterium]|nr:hypothetical protein [Dehalococcoidia bacterium]